MNYVTGDSAGNALSGTGEEDLVQGYGGDDTLLGAGGNDTLEGGEGTDTTVYTGILEDYRLAYVSPGWLEISDFNLAGGNEGTDSLTGIERLEFGGQSYVLTQWRETLVDTAPTNQESISTATLGDGGYVAVWMAHQQDGSGYGIHGQRYDARGNRLGSGFLINSITAGDQLYPRVSSLADGGFVVAWVGPDAMDNGIFVRRFNASGQAQGAEVRVNGYEAYQQAYPFVAGLRDGGYVVSWSSYNQDGSQWGNVHQRFSADGVPLGAQAVSNTWTYGTQFWGRVTGLESGGFVSVWWSEGQDGLGSGIYGQIYDESGSPVGGELALSAAGGFNELAPSVTALQDGGFVVARVTSGGDGGGHGIAARRYSSTGQPVGPEFVVNSVTQGDQLQPEVATLADGGWVIVWMSHQQDGTGYEIRGQRYDASGEALGSEIRVNTWTANDQYYPSVTALADGGFVIGWMSLEQDGVAGGVYTQRFDAQGNTFGIEGSPQDDLLDLSDSLLGLGVAGGAGHDVLTGGGGDDLLEGGDGQDTVILQGAPEDYTFMASGRGRLRVEDHQPGNGAGGNDQLVSIENLQFADRAWTLAFGEEFRCDAAGAASAPDLARLADGSRILVWTSTGTEGAGSGIRALRMDADGRAEGNGFQVNTTTTGDQRSASVSALADGGYVVTWISALQDGSLGGVYGQCYRSDGEPSGTEFRVNTTTLNDQDWCAVAGLPAGGFVTLWMSRNQDGSGWGIYGQRFDAAGVMAGAEFRVNSTTASQQQLPAVAVLSDGGFVALWASYGQDGSGWGIVGQRYNDAGQAQAGEFTVNDVAAGNQWYPVVTGLSGGGFVAAWSSLAEDGSGEGVYARCFGADGLPSGAAFRVNTFTAHNQDRPSLESLPDGGFVVTWTSAGQDGSGTGVYARRYDAAGVAASDPFPLAARAAGDQSQAVAVAAADGSLLAAWNTMGSDGVSHVVARVLDGQENLLRVGGSGLADAMDFRRSVSGLVLEAGEGDDTLRGGLGGDVLVGGTGDDVYVHEDASADLIVEQAGEGLDTSRASVSLTLSAQVEDLVLTGSADISGTGNAVANRISGNAGANRLDGAEGDDLLDGGAGADTLAGGAGADTYVLESAGDTVIELAGEGVDAIVSGISLTLVNEVENLQLAGHADLDGAGNTLDNTLTGSDGNNRLDGGAGADTLSGGEGDDTYVLDQTGDEIVEQDGSGLDTVESSISCTLGAHVENLLLTGSAALSGTGNELANLLTGNSAANLLSGGDGDDSYSVDSLDILLELEDGGTDTVLTASGYTLGNHLENLTFTGSAGLSGLGNTLDNRLTGNSGGNTLKGYWGRDTMSGGLGNDTYYLDSSNDVILELAGEGTDQVYAKSSYTLSANLERLSLLDGVSATGNTEANVLAGNALANVLDGGGGKDALYGKTGNDTYVVDSADDTTVELAGEGTDTVRSSLNWTLGANVENLELTGTANLTGQGNTLANMLSGNAGNNVLRAYDGRDTVSGGLGNDSFYVDSSDDVVIEQLGEGTDTVYSRASFTLGAHVDRLTLLEGYAGALDGTGNGDANVLTGNGLGNVLRGGAGNDTVVGKAGNDRYEFGRGDGQDSVTDQDGTAGNLDELRLLSGISHDQLWFSQSGTDLVVSVIGTQDRVTVRQWYVSGDYRVEEIRTEDGARMLAAANVQSLVSAMASLTPPALGQTSLDAGLHAALDGVIAASWV